MAGRAKPSEVFDVSKSGALILGKDRLEDYATKYLSHRCAKALETPMPLPIDEILEYDNLTVKEVRLSKNLDIFGCCMLLTGEVNIYDEETDTYHPKTFEEGTILFDPKSEARFGDGAKRNTIIHEALHWEKDKTFFEILKVKNRAETEKLSPIMCRSSKTFYEPPEKKKTKENEVRWMEWQAHRLAPRVLMPYEMFRKKAKELIEESRFGKSNVLPSCDGVIEALSEFFIVSRSSVKYRLLEVGLRDEISRYEDYDAIFEEINGSEEYAKLTPIEAYQLLQEESLLQEWVSGGRFIFADGYFVLSEKEYVVFKNGEIHLSAKAKRNLEKCVLNIHEQKYIEYPNFWKDYAGYAMMFQTVGMDKRLFTFHPKYQSNIDKLDPATAYDAAANEIFSYDVDAEREMYGHIVDPSKTLCQTIVAIMDMCGCDTSAKFNRRTLLHKNYYSGIKNDKKNDMKEKTLMAICVGMKLNSRLTQELFKKSVNNYQVYVDPYATYTLIMEQFPSLPIDDFNEMLSRKGMDKLGTEMRDP